MQWEAAKVWVPRGHVIGMGHWGYPRGAIKPGVPRARPCHGNGALGVCRGNSEGGVRRGFCIRGAGEEEVRRKGGGLGLRYKSSNPDLMLWATSLTFWSCTFPEESDNKSTSKLYPARQPDTHGSAVTRLNRDPSQWARHRTRSDLFRTVCA